MLLQRLAPSIGSPNPVSSILFLNQDFPPGSRSEGSRSREEPLRNHRKECKGLYGHWRGVGRSLEKGMATHSSALVWRIPWTRGPGGLYNPQGRKESDTERLTQKQGECQGQPTEGGCRPSRSRKVGCLLVSLLSCS